MLSAFNVDDHLNTVLADWYGIVMGTSHEEPMSRSIPVEWNLFGVGAWDYSVNAQFIYDFWVNSTERARDFETLFTVGMRGNGDCTLRLFAIAVVKLTAVSSTQRKQQYRLAREDHLRPATNYDRRLQWNERHHYPANVVPL